MSSRRSFLRGSPLAYLVVPLAFTVVTAAVLGGVSYVLYQPYASLVSWFFTNSETDDNAARDLLAGIDLSETAEAQPEESGRQTIPVSSITYPAEGDRYAEISIEGTSVSAPVYYGDTTTILNQGVGTYKDDYRCGLPGESKTILMAGHNNTFFNGLQQVEAGDVVTIETHYGVYTYEVTEMQVKDYQDETAYDFTRTDENLILYTCYPFDALGFTPNRYFVYAKYLSGPALDLNS